MRIVPHSSCSHDEVTSACDVRPHAAGYGSGSPTLGALRG